MKKSNKKAISKKQTSRKVKREPSENWTETRDQTIYWRNPKPYAVIKEAFVMDWDEFKLLNPRRISTHYIAWENKGQGDEQNILKFHKCEIFITEGYIEKDGVKINIAYSFFVRWDNRTWKASDLDDCLYIVESMRLLFVKEVAKHGTGKSKKNTYLSSPISWAIK